MKKLALGFAILAAAVGMFFAAPAEAAENDFREYCASLAESDSAPVIAGNDGWLFLRSEIRFLGAGTFWGDSAAAVSKAAKPEWRDPLPPILDFHRQLTEAGIRLLVVPIPPKAEVYPDMLPNVPEISGISPRPCAALGQFLGKLVDAGVEVLDLQPIFSAARNRSPETRLYCRTDSHWTPWGAWLAARAVAAKLDGRIHGPALGDGVPPGEPSTLAISGDLFLLNKGEKGRVSETLPLWRPRGDLGISRGAKVLLLGDSHGLAYQIGGDMFASGSGFPAFMSACLGAKVDLMAVRGSAATPVRVNLAKEAAKNPEYLKGKNVVVWFFAAREFSESPGWRMVPLKNPVK